MNLQVNWRLAAIVVFSLAAGAAAEDAPDDAVYRVTYCEALPGEQAAAAGLLGAVRDAGRRAAGNLRFDLLRESGRPDRFVLVEAWQSQAGLDGNDKAAPTQELLDKFKLIQSAPCDMRRVAALRAWSAGGKPPPGAVQVVTHVDVAPPFADQAASLLGRMFDAVIKQNGNLGTAVLQQTDRKNHFTVVETWADMAAFDAHVSGERTRRFREKLSPMAGALYDERIYAASAD